MLSTVYYKGAATIDTNTRSCPPGLKKIIILVIFVSPLALKIIVIVIIVYKTKQ